MEETWIHKLTNTQNLTNLQGKHICQFLKNMQKTTTSKYNNFNNDEKNIQAMKQKEQLFLSPLELHQKYQELTSNILNTINQANKHSWEATQASQNLQKVYEAGSFDVPPHYPSLRKRLPLTICKEQEYSNKILDKIAIHQKGRRPILILMKTIQQTEKFSKLLHEKKIKHLLLNEIQKEDEDYIVSKAGLSYSIVVATNTAGRGTDIILSPDAKKDGGLHVIFAFYPANSRVEDQGLGRAGRQGQMGSCEVIVHELDEQFCKYKTIMVSVNQKAEEQLAKLREQKIKELSLRRQAQSLVQTTKYHVLKAFCIELSKIRSKLQQQNVHNYLNICLNFQYKKEETMLEINDNPLIQQIIRKGMTLLNLQLKGFKVDWIPFVKSIIEQDQINLIQQKWGIFYSDILSNKYQFLEPSSYEAIVIKLFEQFKKKVLLPYKLNLTGKIAFTITSVLSQSYSDLKSQHQE